MAVSQQEQAKRANHDVGVRMYRLAEGLFPICRSLTDEGVRQTFSILKEIVPIQTHEVPSGTKAFDWKVSPADVWAVETD